ncbi:Xanthine dehydrogenase [Pseudolycoriella hygida]|uniref:Xanthine dehydrogenase n=1 Tax=Pseudolycoriella hygida TaxID=35572 RepID=A0A9Q0S4V8_9DIPT|nr:Xanthine dehydrogenase [Pseudolycoriella hygida]
MEVTFSINGKPYKVTEKTTPIDTSLNTFIRNYAHLKGTKFMCLEGGCGVCIVTLKGVHPVTKKNRTWAVNSCLFPVLSCHGLEVTTIEGVGNKKDGYHPAQERLWKMNGTQCGYCSPAMVMNMYSLLEANDGKVTMEEIENSFGGNICRCTGYRPILDAFKSLAVDADEKLIAACMDIEDLSKVCPKTGSPCAGSCHKVHKVPVHLNFGDSTKDWHKVYDLQSLFDVLSESGNKPYMLVAGNTAHGVYRRSEDLQVFIDINDVDELRSHSMGNELVIGANVNLTETMDILSKASATYGLEYCKHLVKHIDLIANVPVRNSGTIAGNLSIKHAHKEFPSDMFIILEGCGATLTITENGTTTTSVSVADYLQTDMTKKVLLNVKLPLLDPNLYKFRSYKIMPRAQNAHAYVNAAFLLKFNGDVVDCARICFGGIKPSFIHASDTEKILQGKTFYTDETLQTAITTLNNEINPDWVLPDASPEYRKNLAISLFYKFVLNTAPEGKVKPEHQSGGEILQRTLSSGKQEFDTYEDKFPLTQPLPKYEGLIQVSGEAQYINDIPNMDNELWAAFVPTSKVRAKIGKIDASEALQIPGVRYFFSAKDIPGKNNFSPKLDGIIEEEEIFVGQDSEILFYGQPAGVILADTLALANSAASKVKITYVESESVYSMARSFLNPLLGVENGKQIIPTLQDAYALNAEDRFTDSEHNRKATHYGTNTTKTISGRFEIGGQYHYTMETQTTCCVPAEDGMDVYSSTQWMDYTHIAVAECLKVPENSINMVVRRLGGGYGAKISRGSQIACACALACHLTHRPVRFVMTIESNMTTIGKRYSLINEYVVEVDDNGKIQKLKNNFAQDYGCSLNESVDGAVTEFFRNCYLSDTWDSKGHMVRTDAPSHTWCRAPGTTEDYTNRLKEVDEFNKMNRWRKRGIAVVPMKYPLNFYGNFSVFVCIYHYDGTVAISHGGIEMGQGINTKVAQVAAHVLGIPYEFVKVKPSNNLISANAFITGGSQTSEVVCFAVMKACETLLDRLKPVRNEMKDAKWPELTKAAYAKLIDLSATHMFKATETQPYVLWGLSCAEIETDLLTGNIQLRRVDILEDTGESMSPLVDVGQVEGSFIMGIGYWLTELLVYNRENGELLTNRTWSYKPPGAKDIPVDFRIKFLQKSSNPFGVLRSKATGEPGVCMSIVVLFALRHALDSARKDAGITEKWFRLGAPSTPDVIFLNSGNSISTYKLHYGENNSNRHIAEHIHPKLCSSQGNKVHVPGGRLRCLHRDAQRSASRDEKEQNVGCEFCNCLWPVFSCHGLDVTTIEGVGNKKDGYHPAQERLWKMNGTQCGYCSPAMIMNMYSLLEANDGKVTMEEIENSFGGNICRCTGYRPILDAFKSLAVDADEKLIAACMDIEDLSKVCPKTGSPCAGSCHKVPKAPVHLNFGDSTKDWHKVYDLQSLFDVLSESGNKPYMLVAGNTAHGVYRRSEDLEVFIDVNDVDELRSHSMSNELVIGANVNLTETMDILSKASTEHGFEYCKHLVKHIDLIANVPVRNSGTIAGNLSIKHAHKDFPSDMFIILEGCGATLSIMENGTTTTSVSVADYLQTDMTKKVLLNVKLPLLDPNLYKFRSYKIMPRAQNAHAYVNAAFLLKFNGDVVDSARICFGGIKPSFIHASDTEKILQGKTFYTDETLQLAITTLNNEIHPDWVLPDASPEYRKNLAISLFYKFVLNTAPEGKVKPEHQSGGEILQRTLSSGKQEFDTYEDKFPLTQPIPKYEGLIQVSGEAQYVNDIPNMDNELWAAFVPTSKVRAKIGKIDASEALKIPGVQYFFSAKDIPGKNNFSPKLFGIVEEEEIFVGQNSEILFYGQPAGVILADTMDLANSAATKVKITYVESESVYSMARSFLNPLLGVESGKQIIPTLQDAYALNAVDRFTDSEHNRKATHYGTNTTKTISGRFEIGGQYHYTMETQTTCCVPAEDGMDVYSSTQWMDYAHIAVAECLKVPENSINMVVRRLGGGYGGKISRSSQIACACALACHLTHRPVRFVMTIESNMTTIGKRYSLINEYVVEVDDNGKIQKLKNNFAQDYGCSLNESVEIFVTEFFNNCYLTDTWDSKGQMVRTDAPSHTWCRAPGTTEDYTNRLKEIDEFNKMNRWRKRGIAIVPMKYPLNYFGHFSVFVCIYHYDGTVAISHGGIEMGQGINTKVAQVAAHVLGIPYEFVKVKPSNNLISANAFVTGGSLTSEVVCFAVIKACETLLDRLKPVRNEMKDAKWPELTKAAYAKLIDLSATHMFKATETQPYVLWGLSCAEIETDLLTGNIQLRRVDILEDTGESMSPLVDVGQVEGSFVMGIGYWLTELLVYNRENGEMLTNRTWTYKPPGAKDIPVDFRIKFLQKSSNPFGVLRSKATGEPGVCMSIVVLFALRHALDSARKDAGITEKWFRLGAPSTPDVIFLNSGNSISTYKLQKGRIDSPSEVINKFVSREWHSPIIRTRRRVTEKTTPIDTSLNTFIRNYAHLKGTKFMCLEGGCGVCIVTLKGVHPVTKKNRTWAVNSCLWPVFSCHGLEVTTIEGVGNKKDGYHPAQERLWKMNGTQCGYCSPAMIMNMYSLLEANDGKVTMEEIENSFGGNICRCTGYRPILDAFKSLAVDADEKLIAACMDIEDLSKVCPKTGSPCAGSCHKVPKVPVHLNFGEGNKQWHKVYDLQSLFNVLSKSGSKPYMLVAGNTAHGVYRRSEDLEVFIDVNDVDELRSHSMSNELIIGANVNLTETMDILSKASTEHGFEYCKLLVKHIDLIANVPVRNSGTIAGNLSIKHAHKEFPSDMFIILEGCGATLTITENGTTTTSVSVADYLQTDMTKKVLLNVKLPLLDPNLYKFRSYKITPRAQNAHAYVNAAFLVKFNGCRVDSARICFGGIKPSFIHACDTEKILQGKTFYTDETLQSAITTLNNEIHPDWVLPDASPEYRKNLAISLFYKFVLNTAPEGKVKPEHQSGGEILQRTLSSGMQTFDTYKDKFPLNQPLPKYEGLIQVSGEAQYVNDIPNMDNELWAAFVPTSKVRAKIGKIDASEALKIPGVRYFFSAKDIPGKNNFSPTKLFGVVEEEEIFVGQDSEILFYGQPAGVILADTMDLANSAATKVKITYVESESVYSMARSFLNPLLGVESGKQIIPTLQDAYALKAVDRFTDSERNRKATHYGTNTTKTISGRFEIGGQYHYTMETQTTCCVPAEDGMDVYSSTQWMDYTHIAVAECLKVPENSINMVVRRLGGGYGGKISRGSQIACACALACHLTHRPVRFVMTIESNMTTIGKRFALINEYVIEVDDNGKIQKLKNNFAQDYGCSLNDSVEIFVTELFNNCYLTDTWDSKGQMVRTDAPSHTWCRAPGTTEGMAMIENIMEHISREVGKDRMSVRLANMRDDSKIKTMLPGFLKDAGKLKQVDEFNKKNRWRKRGIAVVPMRYPINYLGNFAAFVCIYHYDGTVAISHGGIEMGQGINTKVAQVAAHVLGIPYKFVKVKPSNNLISANSSVTGGSITSEVVCFAVKKACETLLDRLKPVRNEMKDAKWPELTKAAYAKLIDLSATHMFKATETQPYVLWGLSCAEIETDLLTGNIQLRRVDILEDTGESLSPLVDVGQVEGAFVMGIGYWLTELLVYNRENGELLTNRTWTYKPPGAKDIPVDFRIKFLQKSSNPFGVLRSKTTGEPAVCMSIVVLFALRYALESARKDAGITEKWFKLGAPTTPDIIFLNAGNSISSYTM